jgi:hypothetical protein
MNPHPPKGPPRPPHPEEVTSAGARPRPAVLRPGPDSPRVARPSCVTRPRGSERSSGRRSARPECAAAVYMHHQGSQTWRRGCGTSSSTHRSAP